MSWVAPKTDWAAEYNSSGEYIGDFLNLVDYRRICGNLTHLKTLYATYNKPEVSFQSFTQLTIESLAHAAEWNIIESNLEDLITKFGGLSDYIGNQVTYTDNGKVINYTELNRIESVSLMLYEMLPLEYAAQKQLQYSLGLDNIGEFSTRVDGVE